MGSGKSLIDQIQDALRRMEDSGFLDDLADQTDADDGAHEKVDPMSDKPDAPHDKDESAS